MVPLAPEQSASEHASQRSLAAAALPEKTSTSGDLAEERMHQSYSRQQVDEQPNHANVSTSTSASEEDDDSSEPFSSPSTTPVQWEAWSLPTETGGHFESATDLALYDGSCPLLTTASSSYDDSFTTPSPMLASSMRSRMVSLPNLAEEGGLAQRRARNDTAQKNTTTKYNKRPTPTTTSTTTAAAGAAATPTSSEQLQIRNHQSEIDQLQSQLRHLHTAHERAARSSQRYRSRCRRLQTQLDESSSENVLLRREVTDLRTLARLEEDARWRGALDALVLEDARGRSSATPPPAEVEVEIPVSHPKKRDGEKTKTKTTTAAADVEKSSLGVAMELTRGGLERHEVANRVA